MIVMVTIFIMSFIVIVVMFIFIMTILIIQPVGIKMLFGKPRRLAVPCLRAPVAPDDHDD